MRALAAWWLSAAVLTLAACGPSRSSDLQIESSAGPPTGARADTFVATCPPNTVRIGGAFSVSPDSRNTGLIVRGSYPNDNNGWTVEVENTVPVESDRTIVMSLAYCLARDGLSPIVTVETKSKTVQIGQQTGGAALRVECPPDGALTGGGFRIAGDLDSLDASFNAGLQSSRPDPGGWNLDMGQWIHNTGGQREYSAYAVCTSSPIQRGQILEASFNFNTDPHDGHSLVTFAARCTNPNSFTTAGGFDLKGDNTDAHRAWSSNSRNEFSEWRVDLDTNKMTADPPSAVTLCTPKCRSNVACVVTPPAASQ